MTPEQTVAVIKVMDEMGVDAIYSIEEVDDYVKLSLCNDCEVKFWSCNAQAWYQHGELHRDDGPAMIRIDGTQEWYQSGERHRNDGPAVIYPSNSQRWFLNGKLLSQTEHA